MSDRLEALANAGVSIWLDDLSRERIESGNLADLVKEKSVVGVTTTSQTVETGEADRSRDMNLFARHLLCLFDEVLRSQQTVSRPSP